jgi:UDP-glucose 4-epimerase
VAEALARDDHDVTIYSRSFSEWLTREQRGGPGKIRLVEGEIPPADGLRRIIAEADIVYYLAGSSTPASASSDPGASITRHVVPAAAVLDLMRETPTRRIVIASSGGTVYGAATRLPTPEDHPTKPINLHGHHSLTIERYAEFFAETSAFEVVVLRFANPYGPGQLPRRGQGVIAAWSQALARDESLVIYGNPATRRDFIYIDDLVRGAVGAGFQAPPGTYNVGSGRATSLQQVIDLLLSEAGADRAKVAYVDARPVDVAMTQLDCTRIRDAIGWEPTVSLTDGIRQSWLWMRDLPYRRDS